jgi:hypothetical protein
MKLWRLAGHALAAAILSLVVFGAGVAGADCNGFGPGILGSDNCGPSDTSTGGGRDTVYDSWPPGMDWGWNGADDNTPIVLPAP